MKARGNGQRMSNTSMPGSVVSIKVLQTPRFSMPAQPTVLLLAFSLDGWVGETQFPVDLSTHIYLPVMAARVPTLETQDVKGVVKAALMLREILPYICESNTVPFKWNNQLGMGSGRVQDHSWGICEMKTGSELDSEISELRFISLKEPIWNTTVL